MNVRELIRELSKIVNQEIPVVHLNYESCEEINYIMQDEDWFDDRIKNKCVKLF